MVYIKAGIGQEDINDGQSVGDAEEEDRLQSEHYISAISRDGEGDSERWTGGCGEIEFERFQYRESDSCDN